MQPASTIRTIKCNADERSKIWQYRGENCASMAAEHDHRRGDCTYLRFLADRPSSWSGSSLIRRSGPICDPIEVNGSAGTRAESRSSSQVTGASHSTRVLH